MAYVAGEWNGVLGLDDPNRVLEAQNVIVPVVEIQLGWIFGGVTNRIALSRSMTSQKEIDSRMSSHDLAKRETGDMAIIEIQNRDATALNDNSGIVESVLVRRDRDAARKVVRHTMRHFDDILKAQRFNGPPHSVRGKPCDQNLHRSIKLS